jgi:uncharacterized integral membrane protein
MVRLFILIPFLILLTLFVAVNQTPLQFSLLIWSWQSSSGVIVLLASIISFLLGAFLIWISELSQRHRARKAELQVRELETRSSAQRDELLRLRGQLTQVALTPVSPDTTVSPVPPSSSV